MYTTKQEEYWASDFGQDYITRNKATPETIASSASMFAKLLPRHGKIASVMELGANIGINMHALRFLLPAAKLSAVEINPTAAETLRRIEGVEVRNASILNFEVDEKFDFVFTSGVLIHINPEFLPVVYRTMYNLSSRYICLAEYYNPVPVEVPYRNLDQAMFKRDFAGEFLDLFPDVRLLDYGFTYHRDAAYIDDLTWFLLEKPAL